MPKTVVSTEEGFAPLNTQNVRTKDRVRDLAEVFTAQREVEAMLDLVGAPSHNPDTVVLSRVAETGIFLSPFWNENSKPSFPKSAVPPKQRPALSEA